MRKLVIFVGLIVVVGGFGKGAGAQGRNPTIVEGYVFNKWTGAPLEGARMLVAFRTPDIIGNPSYGGQLITDRNGFYSIQVTSGELIWVSANCYYAKGGASSPIHLPVPAEGLIERNAYLDVPRRRSFTQCTGLSR